MEAVLNTLMELIIPVFLPVVASVLLYYIFRKTKSSKMTFWAKQIIIGIVFGLIAIYGTENGVRIGTATINARDAAPLCAGLFFSGPAGIIAGCIGGIERWFAAYWGAGAYSQIACSVSTIFAGFFAAWLRKYMFDNKRPTAEFSFFIGLVMEVIHLSVLLLTHLSDASVAYQIVRKCAIPMILANAFSVFFASIFISIIGAGKIKQKTTTKKTISERVQFWLLIFVIVAYLLTTGFVYILQTNTDKTNAINLLSLNIDDVTLELDHASYDQLLQVANNRHVGSTGVIMVANETKSLICNPNHLKHVQLATSGIDIVEGMTEKTKYEGSVYGVNCYWMYKLTKDSSGKKYYVIATIPKTEVFKIRDESIYVNSFMEVIVFALLFFVIYFLIKKLVVNNIRNINEKLNKIIGGNLDITVDVRNSSEFCSLSDDINSTVTTLKHYIDEAAARIDAELEFAKNIQHSSLPSVFPAFPDSNEFDIYATMDTAKEVGGDFYDFYMLKDNHLAFLVADVSGKGIPAAMFMMRAKTTLKNFAEVGFPVNDVVSCANSKLCEGNDAGMFVTGWMGIIDLNTGHVQFANAGHNPPLIYRNGEGWSYFKSKAGLVMGCMDGVFYKMQEFDMKPGDRFYLYTDGVTEATDINDQLYGEEKLNKFLDDHANLSAEEMLKAIKVDIDAFAGERDQFDDITMVMLDYFGPNGRESIPRLNITEENPAEEAAASGAEVEQAGAKDAETDAEGTEGAYEPVIFEEVTEASEPVIFEELTLDEALEPVIFEEVTENDESKVKFDEVFE